MSNESRRKCFAVCPFSLLVAFGRNSCRALTIRGHLLQLRGDRLRLAALPRLEDRGDVIDVHSSTMR